MSSRPPALPFGGGVAGSAGQTRRHTSHADALARQPVAAVVTRSGSRLVIKFSRPYPPWRHAIQQIPGHRYDKTNEAWIVHVGAIRQVRWYANQYGWVLSQQVQDLPDLAPEDFAIQIGLQGEQITVDMPWRDDVLPTLTEHDARFDGATGRWFLPAEKALDAVLDLQRVAQVRIAAGQLRDQIEHASRMLALSRALEPSDEFQLTDRVVRQLKDFQLAGVEYASLSQRCFLWGTMGSGKTTVLLAALEQLEAYGIKSFPALVIPPAGIKTNWAREVKAVVPHRSVHVIDG